VGLRAIHINGAPVALDQVSMVLSDGRAVTPAQIAASGPLPFPLRAIVTIQTLLPPLPQGKHDIELTFETKPFGKLQFKVEDAISDKEPEQLKIPRDATDDYSEAIIKQRQKLVEQFSGAKPTYLWQYSIDPHSTKGNIENFIGVAQVPIGLAGPLRINGEHAQGDFLVPLATAEGTLVASYNRGMKIMNLSGGVKVTVVADAMQRAPVFVFADARAARDPRFLKPDQITPELLATTRQLDALAKARGQSLAQMALAWVLRQPAVTTALIGASKTSQIEDNLGALTNLAFTADELAAIDRLLAG